MTLTKYIIVLFVTLTSLQSFGQSYDPKTAVFNLTETLPKCKGGVENINTIFNKNYTPDNDDLNNLKALTILIDYTGDVSIVKSEPVLDSTIIDTLEVLFNSIEWQPAYQREQATNFQAILNFKIDKDKFIIENAIPDALKDGSYSSEHVPKCLIETF